MKAIDITGQKFNRLTAVRFSHKGKWGKQHWLYACECGKVKVTTKGDVTRGKTRSCGCYQVEKITKHGFGGRKPTSEYNTWQGMKKRCLNPNNPGYKYYGGRGIKVCDRWKDSFPNFLEDMGNKPTKEHSIDRIDNNKGYSKANCKWSTILEQANNMSKNIRITHKNETKTVMQWSGILGLNYRKTKYHYHKGLSLQEIIDKE